MYYPKSQIKTNLYTNGGEYVLASTKESYKGYYFETSSGKRFTGKAPQDGTNSPLIKLGNPINPINPTLPSPTDPIIYALEGNKGDNDLDVGLDPNEYFDLNNSSYFPLRFLPQSNPTTPTSKDQSLGVFTRYFCKKRNELKYLEIDKTTYTKLFTQDKTIAWDLYAPEKTLWYIKGDKEQIYKANKGLISLIEQQQKWYGFTQFFQDKFLKYYLES